MVLCGLRGQAAPIQLQKLERQIPLCIHKWKQKDLWHQGQPEAKDSQSIWRAWITHETRAAPAGCRVWSSGITRYVRHHLERIWFCLMKTSKITSIKIKGKLHLVSDDSSSWAIFCSLPEKEGSSIFPNLCLRGRCSIPAYSKDMNRKEALGLTFTRILPECSHKNHSNLETRSLWCWYCFSCWLAKPLSSSGLSSLNLKIWCWDFTDVEVYFCFWNLESENFNVFLHFLIL